MASSTSSSSKSWNHDVFLCFRGTDTRMTFVDHLFSALVQQGIRTYLFDQTLAPGKAIGPSIFKAIEELRIAVVVLSENFAGSSFCLNELSSIMKGKNGRGQIVMPIFYQVDPSEVRKQKGSYKESLIKHERRFEYKLIQSWRKALTDVGSLSGWETNQLANGYEAKQIKEIVAKISNKLFPNEDRDMPLASSSSSSSRSRNHDVFVSFKGEGTRKTFVDHLYLALAQKGIYTNQDEEQLPRGKTITPSCRKAIEESRISLILFSKNYANSTSCLDELAYIMKCNDERGQIVMPIYYHLDPSEVRKPLGRYGRALAKHEENINVESWRKALMDVVNLSGFIANEVHEARLVKEIVDTISNELFSNKDQVKSGIDHLKIPIQDILLATNKFAEMNVIAARSGFGKVYKGQSVRHGILAIKKLDRSRGQGDHEFMMEISLLSICKHENIVSLVGFCDENDEKVLVYRYEKNGSLDSHLRSKDLTWIRRLRICLGAAHGLKYLHDDLGPQHRVLHRDVKSANILLDQNWKPKVTDFGLCKIALANVPLSALHSYPCGTPGYVDPQYIGFGTLTQKSDVYSLGVVLFEVLFGRAVTEAEHPDEEHFSVKMAKSYYEEKRLEEMIDGDLRNQMKLASLSKFSTIAYECLKEKGEERPRMIQVIEQLVKALKYQQDDGAS